MIDFSIIIPALNESVFIEKTVDQVTNSIPAGKKFEIILINDCSSDDTGAIMDNIALTLENIYVIHNRVNMNLGGSYKIGVENARGIYVIMIPGDNSFSSSSINEVLEAYDEADIIIPVHKNLKEFRSYSRTVISQLFTFIINTTFRLNVSYYNGIVLHERSNLNLISLNSNSFFYQAEAIVRLLKKGSSYVELSVITLDHNHEGSEHKSSALKLKNIYAVIKDYLILIMYVYRKKNK
jgi:glycosyltransferase involved in cell wall biosynthesis